jgi:hypothetical protein
MPPLKAEKFSDLAALEPGLAELLMDAQSFKRKKGFCANKVWLERGGLLGRLDRLVGPASDNKRHPVLGTTEAHDLASRTVRQALPSCRHATERWFLPEEKEEPPCRR